MSLEYKNIEDFGEYVTGIAPYAQDGGNFNVRVSGRREEIMKFAETATILRLKLEPFQEANLNWRIELDQQAAELARKQLLNDPETVWKVQREKERIQTKTKPPRLPGDRVIGIEVLDQLEEEETYLVSFHFDPETVAAGTRDIWSALGTLIPQNGSPFGGWLWDGIAQCWRGYVTTSFGVATYDYYGAYLIRRGETIGWRY